MFCIITNYSSTYSIFTKCFLKKMEVQMFVLIMINNLPTGYLSEDFQKVLIGMTYIIENVIQMSLNRTIGSRISVDLIMCEFQDV